MRKKLLLAALAMVCTTGAFAYEVGDYILAPANRYKVVGANLSTNGNFASQQDGWTEDTEVWTISENAGPNGENAVKSEKADAENSPLTQSWDVAASGLYVVSYYVNTVGTTGTTTGITVQRVNGEGSATVSGTVGLGTEWTLVADTLNVLAGDVITFSAEKLPVGTQITNIEAHMVNEVYDIRFATRNLDFIEKILNEQAFQDGAEEMKGMLEQVREYLVDPEVNESQEAVESGLYGEFLPAFEDWLNEVAPSAVGIFLTDWSKWTQYNWNSFNNAWRNEWYFIGNRWGFSPNNSYLERPADDGYVASAGIQTSMNLVAVGVKGENALLPPGKYLFTIEAQAVSASNKAQPYGADHSVAWVGPTLFVGKDTITLENDTISGYYWKKYYHIAEVAEGDTVRAGFIFPAHTDKKGGRASLRNPNIRAIGSTVDELNYVLNVNSVKVQQNAMKERIDLATEDLQKTVADGYPWGHDVLQALLDSITEVYNASLEVIDAEGNVLNPDGVTSEYAADLLKGVQAMNSGRNAYANTNKVYQTLLADLETAKATIANPANAAGVKEPFQAVITEAETLVAGVGAEDQSVEYNELDTRLKTAQEAFLMSCATYAQPAPIQIQNANFQDYGGTGKKQPAGLQKGWTYTFTKDLRASQDFKTAGPRNNYEGAMPGYTMDAWRGTTVSPEGKVQQTLKLTAQGIYEYRADAYATDDTWAQYMAIATVIYDESGEVGIDTIYKPEVRLFFGIDGNPDSITVSKHYNVAALGGHYFCSPYALYYEKTSAEEEVVEFGIECINQISNSVGCNAFGFGNNRIFYAGNIAQYKADAKDSLNRVVAQAQAVVNSNTFGYDNYFVTKMQRYINAAATATSIKDVQNVLLSLKELLGLEPDLRALLEAAQSAGIEAVDTKVPVGLPKGVFTMSGMKVAENAKNLKPGLYIMNGRKFYVK
jgi:hypothetical protein